MENNVIDYIGQMENLEQTHKNFKKIVEFRKERNKITKQQEVKKRAEESKIYF
jgi:uncharacterized membrane protein YgaE (UPF0421/DUF939 family)